MKTVRVRVTAKKVRVNYKDLAPDQEHEVPDWFARDLIASGKAQPVRDPGEPEPEPLDFARAVRKKKVEPAPEGATDVAPWPALDEEDLGELGVSEPDTEDPENYDG